MQTIAVCLHQIKLSFVSCVGLQIDQDWQ